VVNAAQFNFGKSYQLRRPVSELIAERMPATLELVIASSILALGFGVFLGVYTGINRTGVLSNTILFVSLAGVSLPTFVIGILFIYIFAVILGVLPSFGRGEVVQIGFWSTGLLTASGLKALILPSLTLSLFQMTYIIRLVRAEIMEILQTDYIKFARARGISNRSIYFGHALRNSLIPVVTIAGINIGTLVAFSIITETVFQWPGMGFLFIQAVKFVDIPIMSAYLVFIALVFVAINFIVDILYFLIDPRLRTKSENRDG
jgi:peptide/nickel transport system permease protein